MGRLCRRPTLLSALKRSDWIGPPYSFVGTSLVVASTAHPDRLVGSYLFQGSFEVRLRRPHTAQARSPCAGS